MDYFVPNSGAGSAIQDIEERTRRHSLQNKLSSPYGMKSQTPPSPKKGEAPGISSVSSQDSNHTTNSVASRRQRLMAISAKNKAAQQRRAVGNPKTAVSPKNDAHNSGIPSSPVASSSFQSNAMEGYDGKEQSSCAEAPAQPSNKNGISDKIKSFKRENDRASPPPPPPPPMPETQNPESQPTEAEPVNKFKAWSEREKKERANGNGNGNRVVAYPSHSSWKGKVDAPSPVQSQTRRVVVPRSPTASVGSVDSSSFSGYQPKPPSSTSSRNSVNKHSWNINNHSYVGNTVSGSPQVPRNFSSPKYGSPQPRYSTGSRPSIESYKNKLKPIKIETEADKSHEKESYGGAIIETPKKSSVSSLHAMFDSQKSTPLMPMNSSNSTVRHNLPLRSPSTPTSVKPIATRYGSSAGRGFDDHDDRSVSSARSASSMNRPVQPVVASWNKKQQTEKNEKDQKSRVGQYYNSSWRMQSPVSHEKDAPKPSWQQRCKPRPIDTDVQDSPMRSTNVEVSRSAPRGVRSSSPSQFSIASMMYSQNVNSVEDKQNSLRASMDWPTVTNEKPPPTDSEVGDSLTDVILDSISDVVPNNLELPSMTESRPEAAIPSEEPVKVVPTKTSSGVKPWENDTRNSVVQSWQMRSSRSKDSSSVSLSVTESSENPSEKIETDAPEAASHVEDAAPEDTMVENTVEEATNDSKSQLDVVPTSSSSDSFIEEKKSGDLSFDEDQILGEGSSEGKDTEPSQHGESNHPRKEPFYDDDSYLSRGDTASRGLAASESMRTSSNRSRTIGTYNSEDMSVYVEDETAASKAEEKELLAQLEQMNLELAVGESDSKAEGEEEAKEPEPEPAIEAAPAVKPNLPRLNPSRKDCDEYRTRYFEDAGVGIRIRNGRATPPVGSVQSKRSTDKQIIDIWATTSQEERNEAISFDETDRWLDCDPESVVADDISVSSELETGNVPVQSETQKPDLEPRPVVIKKPREAYVTPEKQRQRARAMTGSSKKEAKPSPKPKQDVFDPFGDDAEEGGLTVEISDDLFSSNPDPFMTAESFSPLEWSGSPRESNTKPSNSNPHPAQHIGYYNSPDSRFEI